jgi:hypothetical protein
MNARRPLDMQVIYTGVETMSSAKTLPSLLREFNVTVIPISRNYHRGARETCAGRTLVRIFEQRGYAHTRAVIITFCETSKANKYAMTAPTIWAVSDVLQAKPTWFGAVWLEAMDTVDLAGLFSIATSNRRVAAPRAFIATALHQALRSKFSDQTGARRRRPADQPAQRLAA